MEIIHLDGGCCDINHGSWDVMTYGEAIDFGNIVPRFCRNAEFMRYELFPSELVWVEYDAESE